MNQLALISLLSFGLSSALQCLDHNKNPVDWFVIYKLPLQKNSNPLVAQGAAYTYATAKEPTGWTFSNISINDTNSIVGLTLEPLFSNSPETFYILYNDERPDGSINFRKGHTKGLLLGNADGGIWLVHSVPRFPPTDAGKYYYPHNGFQYGQSFLCISLDIGNLDKVGIQLQYNMPDIYSQSMPSDLRSQLPNLVSAINGVTVKSAPWYHLENINSRGGLRFFSFAKSTKFAKELYGDWVSPTLNVNLTVETWLNGPGKLPSSCGQIFDVYNVKSMAIDVVKVTFPSTTDHSKWAVTSTDSAGAKWICIGDINRTKPERRRAGGTVCFSSSSVAQTYQKSIADIEPCA